ncbi:hypothetical protein, partial [Salmonella enterica]|uniref:hypothetical protein n=1 Tax=Salmonella enterica TaxID=28901 RepID=UPI002E9CBC3C|nr:hypothetical protein [Salmonella enterica subsp. enterica serovar Paratyphi A]
LRSFDADHPESLPLESSGFKSDLPHPPCPPERRAKRRLRSFDADHPESLPLESSGFKSDLPHPPCPPER